MKKGIFKRITAFMLAIAMVLTMMPTTVIASERSTDRSTVTASNEKDGITVTKHAEYTTVVNESTGEVESTDDKGNPYVKITFGSFTVTSPVASDVIIFTLAEISL